MNLISIHRALQSGPDYKRIALFRPILGNLYILLYQYRQRPIAKMPASSLTTLLAAVPTHLLVTGGILILLTLSFLFFFLIPGLRFRLRLGGLLKTLNTERTRSVTELQKLFQSDPKLEHLWKEFRKTLHEQKREKDGQTIVVALRATVSAESFFNAQYLVDNRLRTEFFKHLPGIFTGIGIIGTFLGLIQGLQAFKVSDNAGQVRESLEFLLHGVFEAFLVSVIAIGLAMVVTFVEKVLLASLYRCTEDLAQYLDGLYVSGAGEEYLADMVKASQESASQSKILKDSLVGDLKVILQDLTERQIQSSTANNQALAQQITEGIRSSLQGPLEKIEGLVSKASGDQSAAASEMLKDVMASFGQKLNDLFGGQISGINDLNQRTAQAMQDAVSSLHQLVGNMEAANQRSGDAMSDRMASAVEDMERRQADINEQTKSFVEQIRQLVATSQSETNDKLQSAITDLSLQVTEVVGALQAQSKQAFTEQQTREQGLAARTEGMVTSLGESVSEVVRQMAESTNRMQQSVTTLERTTSTAVDKMSTGAQTLQQGAVAFAAAGDNVTNAMNQASTVAGKMTEVSGALTISASSLQSVLADYRANREATGAMLTEVRYIVETAKREASMTETVLASIQSAADTLVSAQQEADKYLESVSGVLAGAHQAFADGVTRTLDRANTDFHEKLSTAVNLLHSIILELEVTLSGFDPTRK